MAQDPHKQVLRRAGLTHEDRWECSIEVRWSIEPLLGFTCSTSFLNRVVLGQQVESFELDVRKRLLTCSADGGFRQDLTAACELVRHTS